MALITQNDAIAHLRGRDYDQRDLTMKMEQATALVINHIKRHDHGWTEDTDPSTDPEFAIVQAAILEVLLNLFRFRGDDDTAPAGPVTDRVVSVLSMLRDPSLA